MALTCRLREQAASLGADGVFNLIHTLSLKTLPTGDKSVRLLIGVNLLTKLDISFLIWHNAHPFDM
jgi:hypothetical protein